MRILHYYWVQYNDFMKRGGGVRVYLENLISLQKLNNEIYILNSGIDYDLSGNCYCKAINKKSDVHQYTIVNSPIISPAHCSFRQQDVYLNDMVLVNVFKKFLKEYFPKTKFILTLHNYYPFCPQVNLWRNETYSCTDYKNGQDCINCIPYLPNYKLVKISYIINTYLEKFNCRKIGTILKNKIKLLYCIYKEQLYKKKSNKNKKSDSLNKNHLFCSDNYKIFREKNIAYINTYFDKIICVSERVKEIAIEMGIKSTKCVTLYIGTKFADNQYKSIKNPIIDNSINIIYMGYMRRDKGFYFFLKALERLDLKESKNIIVTIAAKFNDLSAVKQLHFMEKKFKKIVLYDGYKHSELPKIISNINLGIVPVLWEDNLPQIALELKSMGIPILASDKGGASELSQSPLFKFKANDIENFNNKLLYLKHHPEFLNVYYKTHLKLKTIKEHCDELTKIYIA